MSVACPHCGAAMKSFVSLAIHGRWCDVTQDQLFWSRVNKDAPNGCWLWLGAVNTTGYGMTTWDGRKNTVAHRLAYKLLRGPIQPGMLALHKCDTPRCVNPDHLFFGTDADNVADCVAKGRNARGAKNRNARLSEADVLEIRRSTSNAAALAARFGVSESAITAAITRHTWKHLP